MRESCHCRDAAENPRQLGVLFHIRLKEKCRLLWINAARHESCAHFHAILSQFDWILWHCDRVHVNDAECYVILAVLQFHPFLYGAEIIAKMQIAGRLDAWEDFLHLRWFLKDFFIYQVAQNHQIPTDPTFNSQKLLAILRGVAHLSRFQTLFISIL